MEKIALRDAYGTELVELGKKYDNLFVLDADLTKSTKTAGFAKAFPERFANCGIAEGNMISVAAGLSTCGNIVFASSFAMFAAGRAYEQVRNAVGYPKNNVKVVATHAGLTVGEDGATHQCLEDMALMRAIPGMIVISPSDATQTKAALRFACEYHGPVYIRLGRLAVPVIYGDDYVFTPGVYNKIAEGSDITLMYTGPFYEAALQAREILAAKGISLKILDIPSIKPFADEAAVEAVRDTKAVITIEDHNVVGGFGSAACESICNIGGGVKVIRLGAQDKFGKSGTPAELLAKYGMDAAAIVAAAEKLSK